MTGSQPPNAGPIGGQLPNAGSIGGQPPNPRDISGKRKNVAAEDLEQIHALIAQELEGSEQNAMLLEDFRAAMQEPRPLTVNFCGGITQTCWAVTRPNGPYRVFYMPSAGYFTLCVDSMFGPVDIGVHGRAVDCYGSV